MANRSLLAATDGPARQLPTAFDWPGTDQIYAAHHHRRASPLLDVHTFCNYNTKVKFERDTVTVIDDRVEYDETRYLTLGLLKSRVILVVHTEADDTIRIISARKATRNEGRIYFEQIAD